MMETPILYVNWMETGKIILPMSLSPEIMPYFQPVPLLLPNHSCMQATYEPFLSLASSQAIPFSVFSNIRVSSEITFKDLPKYEIIHSYHLYIHYYIIIIITYIEMCESNREQENTRKIPSKSTDYHEKLANPKDAYQPF